MARKKSNPIERLDLQNALQNKSFKHALISTFTFDPDFFENYCLAKFNSLSNNPNITVITDIVTYQSVIQAPDLYKPKQANLRYLLHPVKVPGAFHPKVYLFVKNNEGRLFIGSANFTRPGITANAELIGVFDFELEKNEIFKNLFQSAFSFFLEINKKWPSQALESNLQTIIRKVPWLVPDDNLDLGRQIRFLHNFDIPLIEQIKKHIQSDVITIRVLSRYFDDKPDLLDIVIEKFQPNKIMVYTQNGTTLLNEKWLDHYSFRSGLTEIYLTEFKDEEFYQPLHAKAIQIECRGQSFLTYGSANFTKSALLKTAKSGNLEASVMCKDIKFNQSVINQIFDPTGTASRLKKKHHLNSTSIDTDFIFKGHEIDLFEINLVENQLKLRASFPDELKPHAAEVILKFQSGAKISLGIKNHFENYFQTDVTENILKRLGKSSTIAQLIVSDNEKILGKSNYMLVTNLMDINTGKSVRRERHIKEAQQSASQFFQVLIDLNSGNDDDSLLIFLNYCDIPLLNVDRPSGFRQKRPTWDGGRGMKKLGDRNLKIFQTLHKATLGFFDRHFKKLKKHIDYGGIKGIGNFMHIWLAMGGILRSQAERAMQGFEATEQAMSVDEWYKYRQNLEVYFKKFENLLSCLWDDYMSPLVKSYDLHKVKEKIEPELVPFTELCDDMLNFRQRLEDLRKSKLKVMTTTNKLITPEYFNNIFDDFEWAKYSNNISNKASETQKLFSY